MNFRTARRCRRQRESVLQGCFQKFRRGTEANWPAWRASSGASAGLPSGFALGSSAAVCPLNFSPARAHAAWGRPAFSAVAAKTKKNDGTVTLKTERKTVQEETIDCLSLLWIFIKWWSVNGRNQLQPNQYIKKKTSHISQAAICLREAKSKFTVIASKIYYISLTLIIINHFDCFPCYNEQRYKHPLTF